MKQVVSVLSPSFNQAKWLTTNVRSVAVQTYPEVEHIVMDGGSTDGSVEVLRAAGSAARWRSEPDRGQSHALNKAFAESTGEIIGWLNSDDAYIDRRAVERAVEVFERRPDVGVVYGHALLVNGEGRVLQHLWAPPFSRPLLRLYTFWMQPSVFIRRSVLTDPMVREDLHYVMDRDLWWRLAERTRFHRLDMVVGLERHQPDRKVLTGGYPVERDRYLRAHGIDPDSRYRAPISAACKAACRLRGAMALGRLIGGIDPAVDLRFDRTPAQVSRQLFTRRASMPLD